MTRFIVIAFSLFLAHAAFSQPAQPETPAIDPATNQPVPQYKWEKILMPAPFAPRDGGQMFVYKDKMWLVGGWNPGDKKFFPLICNNEVWSTPDGKDWTLVRANTYGTAQFNPETDREGRHTGGAVVFKDKMWLVGGDCNNGHYQNDVWNSTDGKTWTCVTRTAPWGPRVLQMVVAMKGKIYVMGGQTLPAFGGGGEEIFYRDVWCSEDGVKWEQLTPKEPFWPQRGMFNGTAVFKDQMWVMGGGTYDTVKRPQRLFYNDVWSSPDGVNWKQHLEHAPWDPRQYHEVAVFDNRLWVMEGYYEKSHNRKDVWHSADGVNWHEVKDTPWAPRHAASVYVFKDGLWMIAGNNMESDVWKLMRVK